MTGLLATSLLFNKIRFSPENVVHQGRLVAGHPGGEPQQPELSRDDGGELGGGGAHQERGGEGDVLPDAPCAGPGHRAHQLQH